MPQQAVKWVAACAVLLVAILAALFSASVSAELSVLSNIVALLGKLSSRSIDVRDIDPKDLQELQNKFDTVEKLLKQGSKGPSVARVQDVTVEVKKGGVVVPVRLYYPNATALANNETRATTVLLHGGAWVFGSIDSYDSVARQLAVATDSLVVSVGYRQPPLHPFPVPLQDCLAAVKWVKRSIASYNGDPQRVALLGDSAGGNLAAAVALTLSGPRFLAEFETRVGAVGGRKWRRKKPLCAVVLASPVLSYTHTAANNGSYLRYGAGDYLLSRDTMVGAWRMYLTGGTGGKNDPAQNNSEPVADVVADVAAKGSWRVSPLLAPDWKLRTLPPVLLLHATTEVLVDEAAEFAQRYAVAVSKTSRSSSSKSSSSSSSSGLTVQPYSHTLHGFFARDLTHGSASLADAAAFHPQPLLRTRACVLLDDPQ